MINRVKKFLGISFGLIFVVLGFIGIFLPILPTTPFLLLAAAIFLRTSDKLYTWLINNKYLGEYIKNYQEKKVIPRRVKVIGILILWSSIIYSYIFIVKHVFLQIVLIIVAIFVSYHILSLKTQEKDEEIENI
ncbi:Inner membrane protein YbaN [Caloramator mitchellensis]|uniref:Inner membrane protein YbaN n=1 Tax=Caloramator mitchellensis TaxID=908809 RepID=A0A0R3JVR5_CALMK|nr:YbaN family protein [Caloramator mitchellensis]KRQ87691.1 Inner membrane protein YbaN [Caloramator mitchellensis]